LETPLHDTAILLFAYTAEEEIGYKNFSESYRADENRQIAEILLQHTLFVAKSAGLPVMPILSDRQLGANFGERLANAFQEVFAAGYQRVICIGSDCLTLSSTDLMLAQEALSKSPVVVGPAADGGAYLIGLHIDCFDLGAFSMLNWQTDELLNELILYSYRMQASMGRLTLLEEKADVDCSADLRKQLEALPVYHTLSRQLTATLCRYTCYLCCK
jgi:uncharacterized protein